ncbi:MAG TPA: hypothetical protein VES19_15025 [Candidatus Limnocylindrales bacterium]|nr:hypothetical protein [Candidatus Limnocylindrales bacterium]
MRFMEARPDGRAVVYAHIQADPLVARVAELLAGATTVQRLLARAVMNGESTDPLTWRTMFPPLFGPAAPAPGDPVRDRSEAILAASLEVADRGEQTRSQFRGAIVEALTERLLAERAGREPVRRERRILFDGRPAEIHPYDVTVERDGAGEAWDCKWGARGIKADVLHQLDDARRGAVDEGVKLLVGLVIFDARRSCEVRLVRERGPVALDGLKLIGLEGLDRLAGRKPA